jgi:hypothetical protein
MLPTLCACVVALLQDPVGGKIADSRRPTIDRGMLVGIVIWLQYKSLAGGHPQAGLLLPKQMICQIVGAAIPAFRL